MAKIIKQIKNLITEHGSAEILRERLNLADDQYDALERKNGELERENETLRTRVSELEKENEKLKQAGASRDDRTIRLDADAERVLKAFWDRDRQLSVDEVAACVNLDARIVKHHCATLHRAGFVRPVRDPGAASRRLRGVGPPRPEAYEITSAGRDYVMKHKLHEQVE